MLQFSVLQKAMMQNIIEGDKPSASSNWCLVYVHERIAGNLAEGLIEVVGKVKKRMQSSFTL